MDTRQTRKLYAYRGLSSTLEAHKPKWTPLGAFKRAVGVFVDCLDSINDLARIQEDQSGAGAEKELCLVTLATDAHLVASAVFAFASDTNDVGLAARVNFNRSELKRGREAQVISRCENILTAATQSLNSLDDDYGITQAKVDGLQEKIDAFRTAQPKPRRTRANTKTATEQMRQCFDKADQILREKLDKLIVQFEASEPVFFGEFTAARRIGGVASRSSKDQQAASKSGITLPKAA